MKEPKEIKKEHVLCISCKKPIHIDELGAINKQGMCHNNICCLIDIEANR